MRITSKGQVTIPHHIRERYGLLPETEVDIVDRGGTVTIVPRTSERQRPDRGDKAIAALRGTGRRTMSTDELLRLTRD